MIPSKFWSSTLVARGQRRLPITYVCRYSDVNRIQQGISENLGRLISGLCAFVSGYMAGFVYGWRLTIVLAVVSPLLAVSGAFISKVS